jgi:hypothetical protein
MPMGRSNWVGLSAVAAAVVLTGGPTASAWSPAQGAAQGQAQTAGQTQQQGQGQRGGGQGRGGQARDALAQPAVGTGGISGTVSSLGAGAVLRRARVTLNGPELRGGRSVVTDDKGQFSFTAPPAGRFTLTASKAGYVDMPYGAKRPGRPGTPIQLIDGQRLERINLSLPKGSVVTGFVLDENGEPAPGVQIRVMRYVIRTGERALQQVGQDSTDDRGQYRIFGLQPGDHIVSAMPRNQGAGNIREVLQDELQMVMQALQGAAGRGGGGAGGAGGGRGGGGLGGGRQGGALDLLGGRGQQMAERAQQIQQQLAAQEPEQQVAYAPVYYPGTTLPTGASTVTLGIGEERGGVDFQLQLVQTAKVEGMVTNAGGTLPPNVQITLQHAQTGMPAIPGVGTNSSRVGPDGKFSFTSVPPGQYVLMARAAIRDADPNAAAPQGRGGRGGPQGRGGGPGAVTQVLWGAADVNVAGQNLAGMVIALQPGMSVTGRVSFEGTSLQPPTDLTRVRVSLSPRGQQAFDAGGIPPAQVDATGKFTITGVAPGKYTLQANAPAGNPGGQAGAGAQPGAGRGGAGGGGQWVLKSALAQGQDALDFPIEIRPNEDVNGAMLTFTDRTQELSGTLQDATGRPTSDFTIVVFPVDNRYWVPQSRRIQSARPDTAGKFTVRGLPPGDYRLTAVTDVETGEWYDPAFLQQLVGASIPINLTAGEKKVQDLKVAGG